MSEVQFQAERQLIHTTMHKAALNVGRALKRIYEGDGWRWHYVSFNSYLEAEFGKRARGYQLKTYAEIVDEALELAAEMQTEPLDAADVEHRLPAERRLRDLVKEVGRSNAAAMVAHSLVDGTPLPKPAEDSPALPPPPPPAPTRKQLKRLNRDQLLAALEALTNVDPLFSRAMVLNIDVDEVQAQIEEARTTLDLVSDFLDEHGGGR